jgi:ABC-type transporter MlaC component
MIFVRSLCGYGAIMAAMAFSVMDDAFALNSSNVAAFAVPSPDAGAAAGASESVSFETKAKKLIENLGNIALRIINKPGANGETIAVEFDQLVREYFDTKGMAKFALGRYNKELRDQTDKMKEFIENFIAVLVKLYSSKFSEYKTARFTVGKSTQKNGKNNLQRVSSTIAIPGKRDLNVVWEVRAKDGVLKVCDVIIEELSMIKSQQKQVAEAIKKKGLDKCIKDLKPKVDDLDDREDGSET